MYAHLINFVETCSVDFIVVFLHTSIILTYIQVPSSMLMGMFQGRDRKWDHRKWAKDPVECRSVMPVRFNKYLYNPCQIIITINIGSHIVGLYWAMQDDDMMNITKEILGPPVSIAFLAVNDETGTIFFSRILYSK